MSIEIEGGDEALYDLFGQGADHSEFIDIGKDDDELVTAHLGRLLDEGRARPFEISMAKLNNVREAMTIARTARDILGARGILADNQVIRHLCDLEAMSTLEGTESIQTLIIGQELTGIGAFR